MRRVGKRVWERVWERTQRLGRRKPENTLILPPSPPPFPLTLTRAVKTARPRPPPPAAPRPPRPGPCRRQPTRPRLEAPSRRVHFTLKRLMICLFIRSNRPVYKRGALPSYTHARTRDLRGSRMLSVVRSLKHKRREARKCVCVGGSGMTSCPHERSRTLEPHPHVQEVVQLGSSAVSALAAEGTVAAASTPRRRRR